MTETKKYKKGQLVYVWYHSTKHFNPPMAGKIMLKSPIKIGYHMSFNKKVSWYFVKMSNEMIILAPDCCIKDLRLEIEEHANNLKPCPIDIKQVSAWLTLQRWYTENIKYLIDND